MLIGVDFDNTIVCCDHLFHRAALEKKLIPKTVGRGKSEVRDYLRKIGREPDWTELQGTVYGSLIKDAPPFPGVREFFSACVKRSIPVFIVSHKTRLPFLGEPHDLHAAARAWLSQNGFFTDIGLPSGDVFLELTKQQKLQRIAERKCTHFIDDLPEFLSERDFPAAVERILFDPNGTAPQEGGAFRVARSWAEIREWLIPA